MEKLKKQSQTDGSQNKKVEQSQKEFEIAARRERGKRRAKAFVEGLNRQTMKDK